MHLIPFYIGSYTQKLTPEIIGTGGGIYTVQLNDETGELHVLHTFKTTNPSYLVLSTNGKFLYCNTEVSKDENPKVQAYRVLENDALEFLNEQPIPGGYPCHINILSDCVFVACYETGNILQYPIDSHGKLQPFIKNYQHTGYSINPQRQEAPHAHQVAIHPNKTAIFACDLGIDTIKGYQISDSEFLPNIDQDIAVTQGGGPRHMVFQSKGDMAYVINELSGDISILKRKNSRFEEVKTHPSLPLNYKGLPSASAIRIHPNQQYLYAANRTLDAITVFKIQQERLENVAHQFTNGKELREFNITPNGKWLVACHQNSNDTVVYHIETNGTLTETFRTQAIKTPVCVAF